MKGKGYYQVMSDWSSLLTTMVNSERRRRWGPGGLEGEGLMEMEIMKIRGEGE